MCVRMCVCVIFPCDTGVSPKGECLANKCQFLQVMSNDALLLDSSNMEYYKFLSLTNGCAIRHMLCLVNQ